MSLTEQEVVERLRKLGIEVSKRLLTDWRQKDYLPPLASPGKGRAQAQGRDYYWTDSRVINQAVLVDQMLNAGLWGRKINLVLWCLGFEMPADLVREILIDELHRVEGKITGNRHTGEEKEDHIFDLVRRYLRAAKRHPELNLPAHDAEKMEAFLNLLTNKDYDLEASPFDDQSAATSNDNQSNAPQPGSLAAAQLMKKYMSTPQLRRFLNEVSSEVFPKAQSDISRLLRLLAQACMAIPDLAQLYPERFLIAYVFGGFGAIIDLSLRHHGKSDGVDAFVEHWVNYLKDHKKRLG